MSNGSYAPYSHDLMARGRVLAEGRMSFLQELYDSGRWERYHERQEFLSMVRESRAALDKWCALAPPSEAEIAASAVLSSLRTPAIVLSADVTAEETVDLAPIELATDDTLIDDRVIDDQVIDALAMALAEDEPVPLPDPEESPPQLEQQAMFSAHRALGDSPFGRNAA